MKIAGLALALLVLFSLPVLAQDQAERFQFYTLRSNNNDLVLLLDSATGKTWQATVDAAGKVSGLNAITVEGLAYAAKDVEQLYSKVQTRNIEGLSVSDSTVKAELDKLYGYGLDADKLVEIREKAKTSPLNKR